MADIAEKVKALLEQFGVKRPPVPVEQITKQLGLILCALPGDDDISGAIIRKDGRTVIAVNPAHHSNRQRFTIAHELGHYSMHEQLLEHVDQNFRVAWRKADPAGGVNWIEVEANRFAAELLIPTDFLTHDLDTLKSIDIRTVAVLANRYGVSKDAMKFRLTNLGILGLTDRDNDDTIKIEIT
jgi:Zn-dependent peptidase ImmA (M78 family)